MKTLFLKGLLGFGVHRTRDIWHTHVTGGDGNTSVVSMRPIFTRLLKRGGRCIHTDIHTMLLGRDRSHREHSRPTLE
ncbi:hypothetical protein P7K49_039595, partial [Saguinus oedipus]